MVSILGKGKRVCKACGLKYAQGITGFCNGCFSLRLGDKPRSFGHGISLAKAKADAPVTVSWWIGLDREQLNAAATERFAPPERILE